MFRDLILLLLCLMIQVLYLFLQEVHCLGKWLYHLLLGKYAILCRDNFFICFLNVDSEHVIVFGQFLVLHFQSFQFLHQLVLLDEVLVHFDKFNCLLELFVLRGKAAHLGGGLVFRNRLGLSLVTSHWWRRLRDHLVEAATCKDPLRAMDLLFLESEPWRLGQYLRASSHHVLNVLPQFIQVYVWLVRRIDITKESWWCAALPILSHEILEGVLMLLYGRCQGKCVGRWRLINVYVLVRRLSHLLEVLLLAILLFDTHLVGVPMLVIFGGSRHWITDRLIDCQISHVEGDVRTFGNPRFFQVHWCFECKLAHLLSIILLLLFLSLFTLTPCGFRNAFLTTRWCEYGHLPLWWLHDVIYTFFITFLDDDVAIAKAIAIVAHRAEDARLFAVQGWLLGRWGLVFECHCIHAFASEWTVSSIS